MGFLSIVVPASSQEAHTKLYSHNLERRLGSQITRTTCGGKRFFLNEKFMCGQPHWISFPERDCFKDNREYQSLRHSWILIERSYPMVPCAENTPLPNRKQSKQQRAKLFSVYLRPWTLLASEATWSKPYIADLDIVHSETGTCRNVREAWKQYYKTGQECGNGSLF